MSCIGETCVCIAPTGISETRCEGRALRIAIPPRREKLRLPARHPQHNFGTLRH